MPDNEKQYLDLEGLEMVWANVSDEIDNVKEMIPEDKVRFITFGDSDISFFEDIDENPDKVFVVNKKINSETGEEERLELSGIMIRFTPERDSEGNLADGTYANFLCMDGNIERSYHANIVTSQETHELVADWVEFSDLLALYSDLQIRFATYNLTHDTYFLTEASGWSKLYAVGSVHIIDEEIGEYDERLPYTAIMTSYHNGYDETTCSWDGTYGIFTAIDGNVIHNMKALLHETSEGQYVEWSQWDTLIGGSPEIFWAEYGVTTHAQIQEQLNAGKFLAVKNGSKIYTYQDKRSNVFRFVATIIGDSSNPTAFERVMVNSINQWETVTYNMQSKLTAGDHISISGGRISATGIPSSATIELSEDQIVSLDPPSFQLTDDQYQDCLDSDNIIVDASGVGMTIIPTSKIEESDEFIRLYHPSAVGNDMIQIEKDTKIGTLNEHTFQEELTAGTGISIENNVISATGGTSYTAGRGIDITNNVISTTVPTIEIDPTQVVSMEPIQIQLTQEQLNIFDNNLWCMVDASQLGMPVALYQYSFKNESDGVLCFVSPSSDQMGSITIDINTLVATYEFVAY